MEKYYLNVFNPSSGVCENVEVTEEFYHSYRRMGWNEDKKEQRYRKQFIPFSSLKGGVNGAFQNFHEFISEINNPENIMEERQKSVACSRRCRHLQKMNSDSYSICSTRR